MTKQDDGKVIATVYPADEYYQMRGYAKIVPHIPYHSPQGFDYGYGGSGPADLSLALLAHYMCESKRKVLAYLNGRGTACAAAIYHQQFKDLVVAQWSQEVREHTISGKEIHDHILAIMLAPFISVDVGD